MFGNVFIQGTNIGTTTNEDGFFIFNKLEAGSYRVVATYIGYDSVSKQKESKCAS